MEPPALRMIRWLLFACLLVPLVVLPQVLFPYLVPRTAVFRFLIEAGLLALFYLVLNRRSEIPGRVDPFFLAMGAFFVVNLVSSTFGYAPLRSFFSDLERMWGLFTWLHLALFYLLMRIALVRDADWLHFLKAALAVAIAVSLLALLEVSADSLGLKYFGNVGGASSYRASSTLGNPGFLAAYLLMAIAIALVLLSRDRQRAERHIYVGAAALFLVVFTLARTRSAILALGVALVWSAGWLLLSDHKRARLLGTTILSGIALLVLAVAAAGGRILGMVPGFDRLANHQALEDIRFIVWQDALAAAGRHPIIGVGMENAYTALGPVFNSERYGHPSGGDALFDRIHNVYLEVLVTSGILGLIAYLAIWGSLFYLVHRGWRAGSIARTEAIVLSSAFLAYLVYLTFWFEEINSFMPVLVLAAYTVHRVQGTPLITFGTSLGRPMRQRLFFLVLSIGILAAALNQYAWKPLRATFLAAEGLRAESPETRLGLLGEAVEMDVMGGAPLVFQLRYYINERAAEIDEIRADPTRSVALAEAIDIAIEGIVTEISRDPRSDLLYGQKAEILRTAFLLTRDPRYYEAAAEAWQRAIELAPSRLHYRHTLAELHLIAGDNDSAVTVLREVLRIDPDAGMSHQLMARAALARDDFQGTLMWSLRAMVQPAQRPDAGFVLHIAAPLEAAGMHEAVAALYSGFLDIREREMIGVPESEQPPLPFTSQAIAARLPVALLRAGDTVGARGAALRLEDLVPGTSKAVAGFLGDLEDGRAVEWVDEVNIPIPARDQPGTGTGSGTGTD